MLQLEQVVAPTENGINIVTLREMKIHLRILGTQDDEDIAQCVIDAAATLHGPDGILNRSVFPATWRRYLPAFPVCGPIELPLANLIGVDSIVYQSGVSPAPAVPVSDYLVDTSSIIGTVSLVTDATWPDIIAGSQAVAITYRAGWTTYPPAVKRAVKLLGAHFFEHREATMVENRVTQFARAIEFGLEFLTNLYRIPNIVEWQG